MVSCVGVTFEGRAIRRPGGKMRVRDKRKQQQQAERSALQELAASGRRAECSARAGAAPTAAAARPGSCRAAGPGRGRWAGQCSIGLLTEIHHMQTTALPQCSEHPPPPSSSSVCCASQPSPVPSPCVHCQDCTCDGRPQPAGAPLAAPAHGQPSCWRRSGPALSPSAAPANFTRPHTSSRCTTQGAGPSGIKLGRGSNRQGESDKEHGAGLARAARGGAGARSRRRPGQCRSGCARGGHASACSKEPRGIRKGAWCEHQRGSSSIKISPIPVCYHIKTPPPPRTKRTRTTTHASQARLSETHVCTTIRTSRASCAARLAAR